MNHTAFLIIYSLLLHFIKIYLETNKSDISSGIVQGLLKRMRKIIIRAPRRERFTDSNLRLPILCPNRASISRLWHHSVFFLQPFLYSPTSRLVSRVQSRSVGYRVCPLQNRLSPRQIDTLPCCRPGSNPNSRDDIHCCVFLYRNCNLGDVCRYQTRIAEYSTQNFNT